MDTDAGQLDNEQTTTAGDECVGIASSTISANERLRGEVTRLIRRHHAPDDAILMEGWAGGLARRMSNGDLGGDLDDAAMVIGATRVFSDEHWTVMTAWLQRQLHGRTSE